MYTQPQKVNNPNQQPINDTTSYSLEYFTDMIAYEAIYDSLIFQQGRALPHYHTPATQFLILNILIYMQPYTS